MVDVYRYLLPVLKAVPGGIEFVRDVEVGAPDGRRLHLNYARPRRHKAALPVVVYLFGGGWRGGSPEQGDLLIAGLAFRGYFAACIDYRLSQEAKFPAQLHDCKLAIRHLRANAASYGLDPERIGAFGISAGGHLAALLGTTAGQADLEGDGGYPDQRSDVQAVADWSGPVEFLRIAIKDQNADDPNTMTGQLIGGPLIDNQEKAARAYPTTYLPAETPPFLIVHGAKDPLVPPDQSVLLHESLQANGSDSRLLMLPDKGHGFLGFDALRQTFSFMDRQLKQPRKASDPAVS